MQNLIEFLEDTYKTKGGFIAVEADEGTLSFSELRDCALQVCDFIARMRGRCCEKKMIAVYLPKGAKCLCAMLGVLYSGNVYVPLDCRAPVNRTNLILDIIEPILIITDAKGKQQLSGAGVPDDKLVDYNDMLLSASGQCSSESFVEDTLMHTRDTDPAYLLFTSGSTGIPKGVVIPHSRVINYIGWAQRCFAITGSDVIGNQAPFYFTVSVMDIYLCLATGAKLCIIPENLFSKPERLLEYLEERDVSLIFWVSSVYHHIAQAGALENIQLKALKHAWFVGEPMPAQSLHYWIRHLPETEFANLYGSTETDMTIYHRIPTDFSISDDIPLGRPCANTGVMLLRDDLTEADPGEIGEICIRGACLALGYYKDDVKTQAAFIQNPLHSDYRDIIYRTGDLGECHDGLIFFHGRRDHQFKHLGYRIEAGEIESVASKISNIMNACVIYDGSKRQIVLFYEVSGEVSELELRRVLMADLPVYMVPTRFVKLDAMPLNANKKKDRVLLKARYIEGEN